MTHLLYHCLKKQAPMLNSDLKMQRLEVSGTTDENGFYDLDLDPSTHAAVCAVLQGSLIADTFRRTSTAKWCLSVRNPTTLNKAVNTSITGGVYYFKR